MSTYIGVIDQQTFELLQDLMGEEGFAEIIDFFYSDTKQAIPNLRQAILAGQSSYVGEICHKLKSSGKLIGADHLADISTELERYAEHKDAQLATDLLNKLETEFESVQHWIEANKAIA